MQVDWRDKQIWKPHCGINIHGLKSYCAEHSDGLLFKTFASGHELLLAWEWILEDLFVCCVSAAVVLSVCLINKTKTAAAHFWDSYRTFRFLRAWISMLYHRGGKALGGDLQLIRILYENIHSFYSLPTLNLPNYVRFRFDQLKEITGSGKTDSSTCSSAQCYIFCSSLWFIKTLRVDEREADVCSLKTSRCSILRISGYWGSHSFHTVTCCCHLEPPPRTIACSKLWFSIQKIIHTLLFLWLKLSGRSADSFLILSLLKRVFFSDYSTLIFVLGFHVYQLKCG